MISDVVVTSCRRQASSRSQGASLRRHRPSAAPTPAVAATLVVAVALVLAGVGPASRSPADHRISTRTASHTHAVVQPVPLFVNTGKRFATAQAALVYCEYGGCSTPKQLEALYDMTPLYARGATGKGVTIALVDAYGSPTIVHDLDYFDKAMGIPNPPRLTVIQPAGKVPPFNPGNSEMVGWATETTLDVECAHAMAPGADLLLVETPVDETEGTAGFPEIETAEKYVVDHHLAEVISQSFGATEQTFPGKSSLLSLRIAYLDAAAHKVTMIAASGDQGATDVRSITANGYVYFIHRAVDWPASDPLVTGVGGTFVDRVDGVRAQPDTVWNTTSEGYGPAASGGGLSVVFSRPGWQNQLAGIVGARRGLPDVAMEASPQDAALIYLSVPGEFDGFSVVAGTSEAAPLFAGVIAVADQVAGASLGFLNPALYELGLSRAPGFVDVKSGDNSVTFLQDGHSYSVTGWTAKAGFDLASGWGTVDGSKLVPELVAKLVKPGPKAASARHSAVRPELRA